MTRRSLFLSLPVFLLLIAHLCTAQLPIFIWSEHFDTKGDFRFAGTRDSSLYACQNKENKEVVVRDFTPGMKLRKQSSLSYGGNDNPGHFLISFISDTGLVHISYLQDKKKDSIFILKGGRTISSMKAGSTSFVQAFYSADRSKLLICNFYLHRKTKIADRDFIVVSTVSGQPVYSGSFSYNYVLVTPESIAIDNFGNAYFGSASYERTGGTFSAKSKAIHHLQRFTPEGASQWFTFNFPGRYIPGIDLVQDTHNYLYIAGFAYNEEVKASRTSEADLFVYRIDPVQPVYTDSIYIAVSGLYPEGKLKADDRLGYSIRDLFTNSTGGFVMVAEQYQQTIGQYSNSEKYNDIVCIRLDKDRRSVSVARIPKMQFGFDNPSIVSTMIHDTVYILYNDLKENLEATGETLKLVANKKEKNGLFLVTIGPDNKVKKELLYGYASGQPMPVILSSYLINDRTLFLCAEKQVGVVKFLLP
jgi:hypothetical protein